MNWQKKRTLKRLLSYWKVLIRKISEEFMIMFIVGQKGAIKERKNVWRKEKSLNSITDQSTS